jgi:hypothetical protein
MTDEMQEVKASLTRVKRFGKLWRVALRPLGADSRGEGPPSVNVTLPGASVMGNGLKVRLSKFPVIVWLKIWNDARLAPCTIGPQWIVA